MGYCASYAKPVFFSRRHVIWQHESMISGDILSRNSDTGLAGDLISSGNCTFMQMYCRVMTEDSALQKT